MRGELALFMGACVWAAVVVGCSRPSTSDASRRDAPAVSSARSLRTSFGPTVAGKFYPADAAELSSMVRRLLDAAAPDPGGRLVGIITPHAGYVYSGAVAGRAWSLVARAGAVRTIVVLGPSHHRSRSTASTIDTDAYRTPIGDVPIAVDVVRALVGDGSGLVRVDPDVLAPEHSVDVQMPFIHVALPEARVVPIVVPFVSADRLDALADLLFRVLPRDGSAIVAASSDLSHFFDYATAQEIDREIEAEIAAGDTAALLAHHEQRRGPCGVAPIVVVLSYSKHVDASSRTTTIERINSGDTSAGDKTRVVGYLAAAVTASH